VSPHPTAKTIIKRVSEAIAAIAEERMSFIAPNKHLASDLTELGLDSADEYWDAIVVFLHEIKAAGPKGCYVGGRPPQRCYEPRAKDLELFAYAWTSPSEQRRLYLKFAVKDGHYYHLDCHEDRP
jgi:hypothetical protein